MIYVFVRYPFGIRSACKIFSALSEAIKWIATNLFGIKHILYLLDDFLALIPVGEDAEKIKQDFIKVFELLGVPLNDKKT